MATTTPSSSTDAQNRSINEIAGGNDVFEMISKNKVGIGLGIALVVIAVLGWGYYQTHSHAQTEVNAQKVYTFTVGPLKEFSENKLDADKAVESFLKLSTEVSGFQGLNPIGIQLVDSLLLQGKNEQALKVLDVLSPLAKNDYARYLLLSRKAVVLEDLGKIDESLKALEELAATNLKIFEGKIYLDMGRLQLKKGDKEKARKSFEYVVNTAKEEVEFVKLANLYLGQM